MLSGLSAAGGKLLGSRGAGSDDRVAPEIAYGRVH